jgi:hypothetical protein
VSRPSTENFAGDEMNDNVVQMKPAKYELTKEQMDAINRAEIEPPSLYGYLKFPNPGQFLIDVCPRDYRREPALRSNEVALYSDTQVNLMVIRAFLAGVAEAPPSRSPDLKDGATKSFAKAAVRYAKKVLGRE